MLLLLPAFFYGALGELLAGTLGTYRPGRVLLATVLFTITSAVLLGAKQVAGEWARGRERLLLAIAAYFSLLLATRPILLGVEASTALSLLRGQSLFVVLLTLASVWRPQLLIAAVLLQLSAKISAVLASPNPFIDSFTSSQQAVGYLLQGLNPYTQSYTDIYRGTFPYPAGFPYWPGFLLWVAPFQALLADLRFAFVASDLLLVFFLFRLAQNSAQKQAVFWPLLWLLFPVSFFVLSNAWTDNLLVMPLAGLALALQQRRWISAAVALGFFCAVKQYSVFAALLTLVYVWRQLGWRRTFFFTLQTGAVFTLFLAPFVWADPAAFWRETVINILAYPLRMDSFSFTVWLHERGVALNSRVILAVYVLTLGALLWHLLRTRTPSLLAWARTIFVMYGVLFFLGRQAFCNYFYFLAFTLLLAVLLENRFNALELNARRALERDA